MSRIKNLIIPNINLNFTGDKRKLLEIRQKEYLVDQAVIMWNKIDDLSKMLSKTTMRVTNAKDILLLCKEQIKYLHKQIDIKDGQIKQLESIIFRSIKSSSVDTFNPQYPKDISIENKIDNFLTSTRESNES